MFYLQQHKKIDQSGIKPAVTDEKNFLNPPKIISNPSMNENHNSESRKVLSIPSLAVSPLEECWLFCMPEKHLKI